MENCHGNDVFCRGPECAGTVRKSNGNLLRVNCNMQSGCFGDAAVDLQMLTTKPCEDVGIYT